MMKPLSEVVASTLERLAEMRQCRIALSIQDLKMERICKALLNQQKCILKAKEHLDYEQMEGRERGSADEWLERALKEGGE